MVVMVGVERIFALLSVAKAVSWASSAFWPILPKMKLSAVPDLSRPVDRRPGMPGY